MPGQVLWALGYPAMTATVQRRLVWIVMAATVILTVLAVPPRFADLSTPCVGLRCDLDSALLSPESAVVLSQWGLSLHHYALASLALALVQNVIGWALAIVLLRRGALDRMTLLAALNLSSGGFLNSLLSALTIGANWAAWPAAFISYVSNVSSMLVFAVFPDGRFVPRWTRYLFGLLIVSEWFYMVFNTLSTTRGVVIRVAWLEVVDNAVWLSAFALIIGAQLFRYYRVSNPLQKVQTRLFVFGLALSLGWFLGFLLLAFLFGWREDPRFELLLAASLPWPMLIIMASLAIAILRYRLWDIDLIIRRTLQYSLLSGLLALLYVGLVTALQSLIRLVSDQQSSLSIVVSTLVIAALFSPLRQRLQVFIDGRFDRRRYDAQRVLAAFAATCRDENDLGRLSEQLTQVVSDTLQPESVSLWIAPGAPEPVDEPFTRRP